MDEFKKRFLAFSSHVICFGLTCNLFYIFICAYLNDYQVIIYVNNYGEAIFEMILFPITIMFCILGLWFAWYNNKKREEVKNKK